MSNLIQWNGMATLIKSNGEEQEISPENGKYFKLKELQVLVGGYIETISVATNQLMVVNEEEKLLKLPYNQKATQIAFENCVFDMIVGDALICMSNEIK